MKMDLFHKRYFIVLILFITQSFLTVLSGNVTHEQQTIAKVLVSFLKIPWINLNGSMTDAVTSTCRNEIATVFENADAGEMWALQMLDATSKIPAGILTGNIYDLGMFDECINVKSRENAANIQGQHCMVSLSIPTKFFGDTSNIMYVQKLNLFNPSDNVDLSLSLSVCVPSSCGIQDINSIVNASIQNMPELSVFEVGIAKVSCSSFEPSVRLTIWSILTISFFAMVILLLLICTACDFVVRARPDDGSMVLRNAAQFSLYTNAISLLNTTLTPESMSAIHGIRILSVCLIAIAHRSVGVLFVPTVNLSDVSERLHSVLSATILTIPLVVETSFVISGFLVSYLFLKMMRSGKKFNLLEIYIFRYLRLTPCIAVILLFVLFVLPHLGAGPIWEKISAATITNCQKNWWTNLLYIQNLVNVEEICLLHTWYLAVDMQLFWLSPIILYPLFYRPKLGLVLLGLFMTASFLTPAIQLGVKQISAMFATHKRNPVLWNEFLRSYTATYNRAFSYFLGILMGYEVAYNKRQISKAQVVVNWMLASLSLIFCGWASYHIQPVVIAYDVIWEMIYVSVARLLWSLAIAWFVYACTQGYGGLVTRFLSLPVFVPLSRMSYSIYLVHLILQVATTAATNRTAVHMSSYNVICQILSDLAVSIVIAFFLCLCVESPIILLSKMLRSRRFPTPNKRDSMMKRARYLAGVEEYLNLTGIQATVDVVIETITSRLDFWQTISDDLNSSYQGPSKTPAEWSKKWKNWRSEFSEMNRIFEAYERSKDVPVDGLELKTGVISLQKELSVFLASVNSEATSEASFLKADITGSQS